MASHETDLCVVGGGMAGVCAALAAARHGAKVALMHDRPVPGGNASSECRMHICGADRHNQIKNLRETGILEELRLENLYRNPQKSFSIWDTLLYEKLMFQPGLELLLNCSCLEAETDGDRIVSATGWQGTTQTYHKVKAKIFADCSGDAILAPLTGAQFRMGREGAAEYGEKSAPAQADQKTMGMTCMFQAREYPAPAPFKPPAWAYKFENCSELPYGAADHKWRQMGYWWIELGGENHAIHDTETLRDELLKIVYGVWDHLKNHCPMKDEIANWAIDWVQFLPAKRESRRFTGAHVLTQNDIESNAAFEDVAAYGGWTMDDHHPAGFRSVRIGSPSTIFHPTPSPYGIPLRCLYSINIANLMFAGRDASCTHMAMSSTRVMGTCCVMGQALGTAAAAAIRQGAPLNRLPSFARGIQQTLLADDCYLPGVRLEMPELMARAALSASSGDPAPLRDGVNRPVGNDGHCWECRPGEWAAYTFPTPSHIQEVSLVMDSQMESNLTMTMLCRQGELDTLPGRLPREFRIEILDNGQWRTIREVRENRMRHLRIPVGETAEGVRFVIERLWDGKSTRVYTFVVT